jgi:hypothetical protein
MHHENLLTAPRWNCSATPSSPARTLLILKQNILATVEDQLESIVAPKLRSGCFKATDELIASLQAGTFMRSKKTAG